MCVCVCSIYKNTQRLGFIYSMKTVYNKIQKVDFLEYYTAIHIGEESNTASFPCFVKHIEHINNYDTKLFIFNRYILQ